VKPSEQFADLKAAADKLEQGQDRDDILALFQCADGLYDRVSAFDTVIINMRAVARKQQIASKLELEWFRKWLPLLEHFDRIKKKEKVVSLEEARR
jgi:hypothetical protein